jgi:hypothetical protein
MDGSDHMHPLLMYGMGLGNGCIAIIGPAVTWYCLYLSIIIIIGRQSQREENSCSKLKFAVN